MHSCFIPFHSSIKLFLDRGKAFHLSLLTMMLAEDLSLMASIMFTCISFMPNLSLFFFFKSWIDAEISQTLFLYLLRWSSNFLFHFINVSHWVVYIEPSLHPRDNCILLMKNDMCYWIQYSSISLRTFVPGILAFIFLASSVLFWFWHQDNAGLLKWI